MEFWNSLGFFGWARGVLKQFGIFRFERMGTVLINTRILRKFFRTVRKFKLEVLKQSE